MQVFNPQSGIDQSGHDFADWMGPFIGPFRLQGRVFVRIDAGIVERYRVRLVEIIIDRRMRRGRVVIEAQHNRMLVQMAVLYKMLKG